MLCVTVVIRKLSWKKILGYWIAQYLAAFISSAVVFGIYYGKLCYSIAHALQCDINQFLSTAYIILS